MNPKLLIYTEQTSPRLQYIFDIVWKDILGIEYELTHEKELFKGYQQPKLSYTTAPIADETFVQQGTTLLFDKGLQPQPISLHEKDMLQGLYSCVHEKSVLPFDMFASAFFLVTRYEEYMAHRTDKHGRFRASTCTQSRGDFLSKPMVNLYALKLREVLTKQYPNLYFRDLPFTYLTTFDIDIAFAYKHKSNTKNFGGLLRSILLSDFEDVKNRILTLYTGKRDPYDTFDYILKTCGERNLNSRFFFQVGDEGPLDKNIPHTKEAYRKIIKKIARQIPVGIHLSYASHENNHTATEEIHRLREITDSRILSNRFHYLKFHFPSSFEKLIQFGIEEDYSLGFASRIGFRMGVTVPVYFFNVKTNTKTNLKLYPISFMDATLNNYYKLKPQQAEDRVLRLMKEVKHTGGIFMGLWHNSSFSEMRPWKGWRKVFETISDAATKA